ncbi:MAG: zf-HC2 domain-containing protein [Cyanobacteria bacterium]|nr:zf-HC2 domain-containing protein [Cyanobacteriota bacterium]
MSSHPLIPEPSCQEIQEILSESLDRGMELPGEVKAHLQQCEACQKVSSSLEKLQEVLHHQIKEVPESNDSDDASELPPFWEALLPTLEEDLAQGERKALENCPYQDEDISAYIDRELENSALFESHLIGCLSCNDRLGRLQGVSDFIKNYGYRMEEVFDKTVPPLDFAMLKNQLSPIELEACPVVPFETLSSFRDNELDEAETLRIHQHAETCDWCKMHLQFFETSSKSLIQWHQELQTEAPDFSLAIRNQLESSPIDSSESQALEEKSNIFSLFSHLKHSQKVILASTASIAAVFFVVMASGDILNPVNNPLEDLSASQSMKQASSEAMPTETPAPESASSSVIQHATSQDSANQDNTNVLAEPSPMAESSTQDKSIPEKKPKPFSQKMEQEDANLENASEADDKAHNNNNKSSDKPSEFKDSKMQEVASPPLEKQEAYRRSTPDATKAKAASNATIAYGGGYASAPPIPAPSYSSSAESSNAPSQFSKASAPPPAPASSTRQDATGGAAPRRVSSPQQPQYSPSSTAQNSSMPSTSPKKVASTPRAKMDVSSASSDTPRDTRKTDGETSGVVDARGASNKKEGMGKNAMNDNMIASGPAYRPINQKSRTTLAMNENAGPTAEEYLYQVNHQDIPRDEFRVMMGGKLRK